MEIVTIKPISKLLYSSKSFRMCNSINNAVRATTDVTGQCIKKKIINRRAFGRNDLRLKARNFMPRYENPFGSFVPPIKKRHDIRREILHGNEARLPRDA